MYMYDVYSIYIVYLDLHSVIWKVI